MSRPEISIKHVPDSSLLPEKLTRGRIYFIEDEGIIKVNHGTTVGEYGKRGIQGPPGPPGEPLPDIEEQISALTDAVFSLTEMTARLWRRNRDLTERLAVIEQGQ